VRDAGRFEFVEIVRGPEGFQRGGDGVRERLRLQRRDLDRVERFGGHASMIFRQGGLSPVPAWGRAPLGDQ
jgi:hypothetical protein